MTNTISILNHQNLNTNITLPIAIFKTPIFLLPCIPYPTPEMGAFGKMITISQIPLDKPVPTVSDF